MYVVGTFEGALEFDPGPLTYTLSFNGGQDIYVMKFDSNGNFSDEGLTQIPDKRTIYRLDISWFKH